MDPVAFETILRKSVLRSKPQITLFCIGIMFISLSSLSGLCVSISIEAYAQLLNDADNDGIEDDSDVCPSDPQNSCNSSNTSTLVSCPDGTFVTDCTNQAQGQSSSVQIQDQITNRECVLSSGTCTRADVLLDDTGEVICDPSLGLECSQYLVSSEQPQSQDSSLGDTGTNTETQDQNTDAGAVSRDNSQGPGPGISVGEGSEDKSTMILKKLNDLAAAAGAENADFRDSVTGFKTVLEQHLQTTSPKPPYLSLTLEALKLWLDDPGYLWGASKDPNDVDVGPQDLVPSASCYASVPYDRYKCNIYVAEAIYLATGLTFKQYQSDEQAGRYFPYRAEDWANTAKTIPHFIVDNIDPQMGDIWSNGHHTGIYLGQYNGIKLYISARDDGVGVYGLPIIQREHGIQIKQLEDGGIFRQYVP